MAKPVKKSRKWPRELSAEEKLRHQELKNRFETCIKVLIKVVDDNDPRTAAKIYYKYFNKGFLDRKFECHGVDETFQRIPGDKLSLEYVIRVMDNLRREWEMRVFKESANNFTMKDLKHAVEKNDNT